MTSLRSSSLKMADNLDHTYYQSSEVISEEIPDSSDMDECEPLLPLRGPPTTSIDYQPGGDAGNLNENQRTGPRDSQANTANKPHIDSGFVSRGDDPGLENKDEANLVVAPGLEDEAILAGNTGTEHEANLAVATGLEDEAILAGNTSTEHEANLAVATGLEDEAQTAARGANTNSYLDSPSIDPETLDFVDQPEMTLERGSVYTTLSAFFDKNPSIRMDEVGYRFKNEPAFGLGPFKEALSLFHSEGKEYLYEGGGVMIPRTTGDQSEVLGQVLYYTFMLAGGFPLFICKPFIFKLLTGKDIRFYDEECLIKSYINYISRDNVKLLLLSAVNDGLEKMSSEDKSKLFKLTQNIAPNLQDVSINESNWRQVMIDLAHLELETPACKSVADEFQRCMKMGGSELYSVDEAIEFINKLNCTADSISIIDKFKLPSPLSENEEKVVQFLFRFVSFRCKDRKFAERFLMYSTSCTIPFKPIEISFNAKSGLMRAVTASTCINLLHIPITYESYEEFEEEFMNILTSNESFIFTSY